MGSLFLFAPQSIHNIALLSRSLGHFGQTQCYIYDPHRLVRERYGKYRRRELRVVSRGTFEAIHWSRVEEPRAFFANPPGRLIAAVAEPAALPLWSFRFESSDIVVLGSESQGLPTEVVSACASSVTIPAFGQTPCLNLAVAASILLCEFRRQAEA